MLLKKDICKTDLMRPFGNTLKVAGITCTLGFRVFTAWSMKISGTQNLWIWSPLIDTKSTPEFGFGLLRTRSSIHIMRIEVSNVMYWAFSFTSNIFLTFKETFTWKKLLHKTCKQSYLRKYDFKLSQNIIILLPLFVVLQQRAEGRSCCSFLQM